MLLFTSLSSGLAPVDTLDQYQLPEETVIYDRTGKVELARFGEYQRDVVTFDEIPPILLDATTAIEDKTFWTNAGFDPIGIVAAGVDAIRGDARGASTITQQLVRARLLDPKLVQDPNRTIERKLKEIIQSHPPDAGTSPGEDGKQKIITAYLNQNYYGNGLRREGGGRVYFGKELKDLTPAEAAILAALPKSPSNYDLVRNADERCTVPLDEGELPGRQERPRRRARHRDRRRRNHDPRPARRRRPHADVRDQYSAQDFETAKDDEVILAQPGHAAVDRAALRLGRPRRARDQAVRRRGRDLPRARTWRPAGHDDARRRPAADRREVGEGRGGRAPRADPERRRAKALGFDSLPAWMKNLEDKDVHNGAMVALDYQTGEMVAYVGVGELLLDAATSPSSSRSSTSPARATASRARRSSRSTTSPASTTGRSRPASMFMDVATDFGGGYTPKDADRLERGPVRIRKALQFSLNIPAVKALALNGTEHVFDDARRSSG